jgi:predicted AAA+ superfamily ATPase
MYKRIYTLPYSSSETCFLWGARQCGKSTLIKNLFPGAIYYDLLSSGTYLRLLSNPSLLREELESRAVTGKSQDLPVIIDEVQKIPILLDEVHWLIVNRGIRFILCGSSARKLKRGHANLLGGRAVRCELFPLAWPEIPLFDLNRALSAGLLPRHYDSDYPSELLRGYVGDYLKEEIAAEALARNISSFSRFLEIAAISSGEIMRYNNVASDCGVSSPTARQYFEILMDTNLGKLVEPFRKRGKRRQIEAPKFYLFDTGITGFLCGRGTVSPGTESFGRAFEQFIFMQLTAFTEYSGRHFPVTYWRTSSGFEVDFILGDAEVILEVKSSQETKPRHLKGLRAFCEEHKVNRKIVVSLDPEARRTEDGIDILPWKIFMEKLWGGEIL